jgi:hypothetical protein
MPSFKDSLSSDEVDQLVHFLRAKHRPTAPPTASPNPTEKPVFNPAQQPSN